MLIELLENKKYKEFVSMFPPDRESRVKVAKRIVEVFSVIDTLDAVGLYKDFYKRENPQRSIEFYEVASIIFRFELINIEFGMFIIMGVDDSGFWIEVLIERERKKLTFDEIREKLNAGKYLVEDVIKMEGFYRIQGDVNLGYEDLLHDMDAFRLSDILKMLPEHFEAPKKREELDIHDNWKEDVKVNMRRYIDIAEKIDEEMKFTFENHTFELSGASYPMSIGINRNSERGIAFLVGTGGGELTVSSEHHKMRIIQLPAGFYYISKSGGNSVAQIEEGLNVFGKSSGD
ncbi:MAG: hypothetical protein QXL94_01620 [Candidatus Parvarchaeum sp.]